MDTGDAKIVQIKLEALQTKLEALDRLVHAELDGRDDARDLQAREYSRRLDELNHAHTNAVSDSLKFLHIDLYNSEHSALRGIVDTTSRSVITMQADLATMRTLVYGAVAVILLGVAGAMLTLVIRK